MPIPRIIHQMWIGDQSKRPVRLLQTWKDKNPSCEYRLWTEVELENFGFINQNKIDEMVELNGKCDIMRHEILYRYGGVFMDADLECINALDDFFFDDTDRWSCFESEKYGTDKETGIVLVSSANQAYKREDGLCRELVLGMAGINVVGKQGWEVCGNRFLASTIEKFKDQYPMKIYPSYMFLPEHAIDIMRGQKYSGQEKIYARHMWGGTLGTYGKKEML